ncbi:MAG: family 78 glycoside hydrolase catalytic domain [Clostridia bacterium]|nr:family 78 glycoside hydrolase catalytic domain [Clostridia bacterium]
MLKITEILLDGTPLEKTARYRLTSLRHPVFGWRAESDKGDNHAVSFRLTVSSLDGLIWDSGERKGDIRCRYTGPELPAFTELYVHVEITDVYGETAERDEWFYSFASLTGPDFPWIKAENTTKRRPVKFTKKLTLGEVPEHAMALYCGIGYATFYVNGIRISGARLDPEFTDFSKRCGYVFEEGFESLLREGDNEISFVVADGYRNFDSPFLIGELGFPRPRFDGDNMLSAKLVLSGSHGSETTVLTGEGWQWSYTNIVSSSVYDGETYDARIGADGAGSELFDAVVCDRPCEKAEVMTIPPVTAQEVYKPVDLFTVRSAGGNGPENGSGTLSDVEYVVDFGQNIAGVARLILPADPEPGRTITLRFSEVLDDDFRLYTAPLRKALATDVYVCAGDGNDGDFWQPEYTYHGFRYCSVSGYGDVLTADKIMAVALYTDLNANGDFRCGSPALNALHKACVQTEKANIHSIFTDCPQRDERMGWMNDATVRFEETPYNFEIDRMYPKVVDDICDAQDEAGRITCTAPFVIGSRPADPVCSSFLVAGYEYFARTGDVSFVSAHYDNWRRWEEFLLSRSVNFIVDYSYYGDWAGPAISCNSMEDARSASTPGILMSTGFSYLNCVLLARFAGALGLTGDVGKWLNLSREIRSAFLARWFDADSGKVATGSQGCQTFALKLGLVPPECRAKAFDVLVRDVSDNGFKLTTGNLNSRYIFDVLTESGSVDAAMRILLDESYPGYGFMLENGATTIWERFELKKDPGMNSHNHPMYASVDRWFYAYILGIRADDSSLDPVNCSKSGSALKSDLCGRSYVVKPYFPEGLLSAQGWFMTPAGKLSVRWRRSYGKTQLSVSVPFGAWCLIEAGPVNEHVGSGEHVYIF